ncbi:MAG TPA: hypothetical protein VFB35_05930 [Gaiellaceae bacterium]|nr:hypothetical protein [Gaiellaceae bacterium]
MRRLALVLGTVAWVAAAAGGSPGATVLAPSVRVSTAAGTLLTIPTPELAALPQQTVTVPIGGEPTTETGPTLASLLAYAGVQYNAACKNDELRWWIEVTSASGAAAVVTAGEIDPGFGNKPAILSLDEDGRFLTLSGPRLVVPNDDGARDLRQVRTVTVGRAPAQLPSATPACAASGLVAPPPPGSVTVNGDVSHPVTLSFDQLQALPQVTQTDSFLSGSSSTTVTEVGPTLASVIAMARPKVLACDPTDDLRFYVEVTSGEDGYAALLSFHELDPAGDNDNALLSLAENGISQASVGPRLTVPGDVRGGRYVSGSAVVTVFRAPTETPIPSCRKATTRRGGNR